MPAKYFHVKKRSAHAPNAKKPGNNNSHSTKHTLDYSSRKLHPHVDRSITKAMTAVSQLERVIARILLIRYEQDIGRLFSTRLYNIALTHLPTLSMRCIALGGPSWMVYNYECEEIKDFFRAAISMDMRQAGERVATKSVLWSYTALRHFAMSNNVPICSKRGLHSLRLLEHYPALKSHVDALEAMPVPVFEKPPHLGSLQEGKEALEDACELKYRLLGQTHNVDGWDKDWRPKVRLGYERVARTLWQVSREFDIRGYGKMLREKLTTKWCDCGCSTDHLGEVCEQTVREEEEENGVRIGKQREWDGRGSGVWGWETDEEEDIWEVQLDFGGLDPGDEAAGTDSEMTVGEIMEWRFFKAEQEKEKGNAAFRRGDFDKAVRFYQAAYKIEPELPHYQLNLAAAHLKLNNWIEAEEACTKALSQHRSTKGYYRRGRARKMLNRPEEAIKDLRAVLKLQPNNAEAMAELAPLLPLDGHSSKSRLSKPEPSSPPRPPPPSAESGSASGSSANPPTNEQRPWARTKADDRRLKIILTPTSAAELGLVNGSGKRSNDQAGGKNDHGNSNNNSNRNSNGKAGGKGKSVSASGKRLSGKESQKNKTGREMEEIVKTDTVIYPSWDRYIVKRVG